MKRHTLVTFIRVIVMVTLATTAMLAAPNIKQVHPTSTGSNPPVLIAIVADHYTLDQEKEFDQDVENFFKYGLLVDSYYKNHSADLRIKTYFEPTPVGQDSIYDFKIEPGVGNCAVIDGPNTLNAINTTLSGDHPVHTIVLGNHQYNFGCTDSYWTYIAVDAVGTDVLQHEMGHVLAELFDEWSLPANLNTNYTGVIQMNDTRNCWPTKPPATLSPHWKRNPKFLTSKTIPNCDLFGKQIWHPYDMCRMGISAHHNPTFCKVCASEMDSTFDYYRTWARLLKPRTDRPTNPTPFASHGQTRGPQFRIMNAAFVTVEQPVVTPDVPVSLVRVVLEINPASGTFTRKSQTFGNGLYVPSYRRNGRFLYEYLIDDVTKEVGVIPDHIFTARGYRGGASHVTSEPQPGEVVIAIPNEDAKTITDTRKLQLVIYRIPDSLATDRYITPLNFPAIKSQLLRIGDMSVK